ncbi:hypothetical protein RS84_00221 [Microbacterium hydrocarbonoxydans]|uniref:Uncharacterized protein n=1 Tax=Microbacterium hydrocarbonoxydans TaxID=273678 RepID=A0A0M2HYI7_9MICO|nr:hypothetical protein [Microbacterium hydrocarbonoxydans]KJL49508.1 hypothetical protein RS84_00221 [Microbacterium hydrocarbonoxydans]
MSTPNIDDVAQTLAEYERLAISTGATVQILPTEFSADGETWVKFWIDEHPPAIARATVLRDGIPTERYVVWAESLPAEDSWRALWMAKPTKLFGAYADRSVLRRAYRDAIGDRREPDEQIDAPMAPALQREWEAEIAAAATTDAVHELHAEMKTARAVTVPRERALRTRLAEIEAGAWEPVDEPGADVAPAPRTATGAIRSTEAKPAQPNDFLAPAGNRAARRKAARKKGGKR